MLVLTRHLGETVVIDGGIQVTVVAVQGDKVRLGVEAPGGSAPLLPGGECEDLPRRSPRHLLEDALAPVVEELAGQ